MIRIESAHDPVIGYDLSAKRQIRRTAQKAGVIRIGCEKSEEQAQKAEEQICISFCGFIPGQVRRNQKSKNKIKKILKKVLDKSAKPLYC